MKVGNVFKKLILYYYNYILYSSVEFSTHSKPSVGTSSEETPFQNASLSDVNFMPDKTSSKDVKCMSLCVVLCLLIYLFQYISNY